MDSLPPGRVSAFTLIEVLTAVAISGLLITAIVASFRGTFVLRDKSAEYDDAVSLSRRIINQFEQDLSAAVPPSDDGLAEDLVGTSEETLEESRDAIEFSAVANRFHGGSFGSDIVKVRYEIMTDEDGNVGLVRSVWDNPLALQEEDPEETLLASDVSSLEIEYYDGTDWLSTWDTSLQDGELPEAVRLSLAFNGNAMEQRTLSTIILTYSAQAAEVSQQGGSDAAE